MQPCTQESNGTRLNLLLSPGLQSAVEGLNTVLANHEPYTHDSLVSLARPQIYRHLGHASNGNLFDFTGYGYSNGMTNQQQVNLKNAELLDLVARNVDERPRAVLALSTGYYTDERPSFRPPFFYIDPLAEGNTLIARNTLSDISEQLTTELRQFAAMSIKETRMAHAGGTRDHEILTLHNDLATEADDLCQEASLGDYRFTVSVTGPHYQIVDGRLYPIHATEEPPVGTYAGIRFLSDLMLARRGTVALKPRTPNLGEAPSLIVATDAGPRLCYPLANLASLSLKSFRSLPS